MNTQNIIERMKNSTHLPPVKMSNIIVELSYIKNGTMIDWSEISNMSIESMVLLNQRLGIARPNQ